MPPERHGLRRNGKPESWTDIYAIGALLKLVVDPIPKKNNLTFYSASKDNVLHWGICCAENPRLRPTLQETMASIAHLRTELGKTRANMNG